MFLLTEWGKSLCAFPYEFFLLAWLAFSLSEKRKTRNQIFTKKVNVTIDKNIYLRHNVTINSNNRRKFLWLQETIVYI